MSIRMKTVDFITRAQNIHGLFYGYESVIYNGINKDIFVTCPEHGEFQITPYSHLYYKKSCPECKITKQNSFIKTAKKIHANRYGYENVIYERQNIPVEIMCNEHGSFLQTPKDHKNGSGCRSCWLEVRRSNTDEFIQKAKFIHENKYDYSKIEYKNNYTKVIIVCLEHGEFVQTPSNHLHPTRPTGCPRCAKNRTLTCSDFISAAEKKFKKKYDYTLVHDQYKSRLDEVTIICPKHGSSQQTPRSHLQRIYGCPSCIPNNSIPENKWLDAFGIELERQKYIIIDESYVIVDGYDPKTNTIYEFWGDFWHGNPDVYDLKDINKKNGKTFGELYQTTQNKIKKYKSLGYHVVDIWERNYLEKNNEEALIGTI